MLINQNKSRIMSVSVFLSSEYKKFANKTLKQIIKNQISKTVQQRKTASLFNNIQFMDDQFDFGGYTPSLNVNSRSGSMKKLTRKNDKSPAQNITSKPNINNSSLNNKKNDDFDQLDQLLNADLKPKKKDTSLNKNQSTSLPKKNNNDTLDSFFDQPSTNLNITSKINDKKETNNNNKNMDMARTSINWKMQKSVDKKSDFDIIDQDHLMPNFSKPINRDTSRQRSKSPTTNQIKLAQDSSFGLQSHTSMRNMRPPLKRKQSQTGLGDKISTTNFGLGLSLAQQKKQTSILPNNTLGLSLADQPQFKPSRSANMGRRGSMDNKSQKKFQTNLTLFGEEGTKKQVNVSHFNLPDKNQTSALRIDSPKNKGKSQISEMRIGESIMINQKHSQFYNQQANISIFKNDSFKPSQTNIGKKESSYSFQKPTVKLVQPPKLTPVISEIQQNRTLVNNKQNIANNQSVISSSYDYQKQIQHIKQAYEKQLNYLQESLDKQIAIGKQTRQRLMKQANNMIQQQRRRMNRINEQQLKRIKQINEWQKKKIQDSYKFEIQNLKSTISQYQNSSHNKQNSYASYQQSLSNNKHKRQIQQLSQQLQLQKRLLFDRQNHLTKRQYELQQKLHQLNNKKIKQDQYYRDQEKLLLEKQNKLRSNILNQKKLLMEEKQKIALEAANMEIQIIKKKQKFDMLVKQQQLEKQSLQNQKHQLRQLNQQIMNKYKQKINQITQQKQRLSNLQAQLIRKLRIIQLKAKQINLNLNANQNNQVCQTNYQSKQNNWIKDRPQSTQNVQRQQKLNQTFQRYNKVQKLANKTNQNSSISHKLNKTTQQPQQAFKLQDYLVAINKNNKVRQNNFM